MRRLLAVLALVALIFSAPALAYAQCGICCSEKTAPARPEAGAPGGGCCSSKTTKTNPAPATCACCEIAAQGDPAAPIPAAPSAPSFDAAALVAPEYAALLAFHSTPQLFVNLQKFAIRPHAPPNLRIELRR